MFFVVALLLKFIIQLRLTRNTLYCIAMMNFLTATLVILYHN